MVPPPCVPPHEEDAVAQQIQFRLPGWDRGPTKVDDGRPWLDKTPVPSPPGADAPVDLLPVTHEPFVQPTNAAGDLYRHKHARSIDPGHFIGSIDAGHLVLPQVMRSTSRPVDRPARGEEGAVRFQDKRTHRRDLRPCRREQALQKIRIGDQCVVVEEEYMRCANVVRPSDRGVVAAGDPEICRQRESSDRRPKFGGQLLAVALARPVVHDHRRNGPTTQARQRLKARPRRRVAVERQYADDYVHKLRGERF